MSAIQHLQLKINLKENHWEFLLILYACVLPFGTALINIVYGLIIGYWIKDIFLRKIKITKKDICYILVFSGFNILSIISLSFSENVINGLDKVLLQSSLLLFPLILISKKELFSKLFFIKLITFFSISVSLLCLLSLINQGFKHVGLTGNNYKLFFEDNLARSVVDYYFLGLSLVVSFVIIINMYLVSFHKKALFLCYQKGVYALLIFLALILILLNSRTLIAVTSLFVLIILVFGAVKNKRVLIMFPIIVLVMFFNFKHNSFFNNKLMEALSYEQHENSFWGGRGMRLLIWDCSVKVIKENPLFGVGVGDQQDVLTLCYNVYMMDEILYKGGETKNAHNIFLQIGLATGLVGICLFLASFLFPVIWSINSNSIYGFFVLFFILAGLTESYLERNVSIAFFSFFNMLCFLSFRKK